ncbi:MAG TPA: hypothetical protein DCX46_12715 [Bacteroidetes bacterium]|nr:hypothetical protein [Bacteroidota bacterium]
MMFAVPRGKYTPLLLLGLWFDRPSVLIHEEILLMFRFWYRGMPRTFVVFTIRRVFNFSGTWASEVALIIATKKMSVDTRIVALPRKQKDRNIRILPSQKTNTPFVVCNRLRRHSICTLVPLRGLRAVTICIALNLQPVAGKSKK